MSTARTEGNNSKGPHLQSSTTHFQGSLPDAIPTPWIHQQIEDESALLELKTSCITDHTKRSNNNEANEKTNGCLD
jgi:hypothetical protein